MGVFFLSLTIEAFVVDLQPLVIATVDGRLSVVVA
jgi:hypothetical protein